MFTALVTGANRGLGFEVARQLLALGHHVLVAARDADAAATAAAALGSRAEPVTLDVTDGGSVERALNALEPSVSIDALVNNAGAAFDGFDPEIVERTIETNYRGAARVTDAFAPRLAPRANVVMVSSGMGELSAASPELRWRLLDPALTRAGLDALVADFSRRVRAGGDLGGWPRNAYRVSKMAMNALTRLIAPTLPAGQHVNAVCPGWVRTRMGGSAASRDVEQGARGIVWAATLGPDGPTGGFFRDGRAIAW